MVMFFSLVGISCVATWVQPELDGIRQPQILMVHAEPHGFNRVFPQNQAMARALKISLDIYTVPLYWRVKKGIPMMCFLQFKPLKPVIFMIIGLIIPSAF